ncbi:MAG TPA: adenosylmethionine--8-amino-7-oxononanoate transaminase [Cyanobacteria bacterium UBA11049]|nr:adenosylmethionine--8-amino-7-oxononanoate transaminase [Cyanobacteria bacterium UBA11049]
MNSAEIEASSPIWHPFTQMKTSPQPLKVRKGKGIWLELEDGRQILDCISSWWVTIHGHSHPVLSNALFEQAQQLEHVIFAGFTHEPAERLAQKLLNCLPKSLTRVFFSDNGSTAVEVALKMAYQYWYNQGEKRTKFISFEGGYHGDTLGAMSVGGSSPWWQTFKNLMFSTDIVPFPATFDEDSDVENREAQTLEKLTYLLRQNGDRYAGIFIEPLVQGAAGMRMCRPQFLQALERLARSFGILLIYDEVMTGFGRTGELFACLKSNTSPDLLCLSKGLSGGCLPLAVTLATEKIYQAFYSDDIDRTFFHSHSYTGNPLACATGIASLELLEQNSQAYQGMEHQHRRYIEQWLTGHPKVEHIRICGTIAAMEVKTESESFLNATGSVLRSRFLAEGFLLRPLGNTIYLMPPYCITNSELESIYQAIRRILDDL